MVKIMLVKKLSGLYPVDESGESLIRKFAMGEIVSVDIVRPRNVKFHQKFFARLLI